MPSVVRVHVLDNRLPAGLQKTGGGKFYEYKVEAKSISGNGGGEPTRLPVGSTSYLPFTAVAYAPAD